MSEATTPSELMNQAGTLALKAAANVETARVSIVDVISSIDQLADVLSDAGERLEWQQIRDAWVDARTHIERALDCFNARG